jgi:hypothetical protein
MLMLGGTENTPGDQHVQRGVMMIYARYDMEGRITTPPTTSGVQKRAGQSKPEGMSKPNIAIHLSIMCACQAKHGKGTPSMLIGEA